MEDPQDITPDKIEAFLAQVRSTPEKNEEDTLDTLVNEALKASELEVLAHVEKNWKKGEVRWCSNATTFLFTQPLGNPHFAGYNIRLERSYGPPARPLGTKVEPVPLSNALQNNRIELGGSLVSRKQDREGLLTNEDAEAIEKDLTSHQNSAQLPYSFTLRREYVPTEEGDDASADTVLVLADIKLKDGSHLGAEFSLNLGFTNELEDVFYRGRIEDEHDLAEANIREGELIVSETLPRSYGVGCVIEDPTRDLNTEEGLSLEDPLVRQKLKAGFLFIKTGLEAVARQKGSNEEIRLNNITADQILDLTRAGMSDLRWKWLEDAYSSERPDTNQ